ncbi:MAG: hypothetical protein GXO03_02195 [Aquificae bacterium]|nr:hypothetical protein [Aquificota bacterium]
MEKVGVLVLDLEGTTREITEKLNEALEGIYAEGNEVIDVKVTYAKEHGLDGFVIVYTVLYRGRELPEE